MYVFIYVIFGLFLIKKIECGKLKICIKISEEIASMQSNVDDDDSENDSK